MNSREKMLYHQIHPLKLLVDFVTGFITTCLAWQHNIIWFLLLFLIPSVIITLLITRLANLEPLKTSSFGKYIRQYMTAPFWVIRFTGQMSMWVAAWFHLPMLIILGFLIILGAWCNGLIFRP